METILSVTGTPSTSSKISFSGKTSITVGISHSGVQLHIANTASKTIFFIILSLMVNLKVLKNKYL